MSLYSHLDQPKLVFLAYVRYDSFMDWLTSHPWLQMRNNPTSKVYHLGPNRIVLLPTDPIPADLVEELQRRLRILPGKSARVLALEAELDPRNANLLAMVGQRAGLWTIYPGPHDLAWKLDVGQFPLVQP